MSVESSPCVGVIICDCGKEIAGLLDTEALCQYASAVPGVVYATHEAHPCSKDGRARLKEAVSEHKLERVMIAGCTPRLVNKLFSQTLSSVGLEESYLDIRNIREHCVYVHPSDPESAFRKAASLIEMGVARLGEMITPHTYHGQIAKSVMLIGSGLSGLTTAITLANNGVQVTLVEQSETLGGGLGRLQLGAQELITESVRVASQNDRIQILRKTSVIDLAGQPGNYRVSVNRAGQTITYQVGAIVVATSALPQSLESGSWYDRSRVRTQVEYAAELVGASAPGADLIPQDIVMILYDEEPEAKHSSPLNCTISMHQARRTKELKPEANVTILFRNLYLGSFGDRSEDEFAQAKEQGVTFFRYQQGYPPVIGDKTVALHDELTGETIQIPFDRVVLAMPLVPLEETDTLAALLRLPQDENGFLVEPQVRLRPGHYADDGIFVQGGAHHPVDTSETLFQAYVTGARVLRFLEQQAIHIEAPVAEIQANLCTGCGNCVQVCPRSAINLEKRDGVLSLSNIDELRCTGCGNCVVVCPVKAIALPGWNDAAILAQINAALSHQETDIPPAPRIVALACEWSAYAAADYAGARRYPYPANVRIIRMNCSARFDPNHILWAFLMGADGVFLGTCYPGECHYGTGNLYAKERAEVLKKQLAEHGVSPHRMHLEFFAGDEGHKFAEAITRFVEEIAAYSHDR